MTRLPHEPPEPWMPDEPPPCRHCAWTFTTGDPDEECHVRLRAEVDRLDAELAKRDAFRAAAVPVLLYHAGERCGSSRAALALLETP